MLLRKRYRPGPRQRLQFLLLLPVLGCMLVMAAMLHPPTHAARHTGMAPASQRSLDAGDRLDFGDSQEWVLEAEAEGEEYGPLEGLPPLISLREDELLVAVASPRARRNQSRGRRGGSYRLIKQRRRQDEGAPDRDWGAQEEVGEVSEEEALSPLGLDPRGLSEALSARLPSQRALPEARHRL